MHYYVDGYNLLFRLSWKALDTTLHEARSVLIKEINRHAALLNMHITLVFDAPFSEELSRGHYHNLEIIFTSRGVSADEYLVELLESVQNPRTCTLVTSDRQLARKVKKMGVSLVGVEAWLDSLRKRSNRKRQYVQKPVTKSTTVSKKVQEPIKEGTLPHPGDLQSWERIFEERFRKLTDE